MKRIAIGLAIANTRSTSFRMKHPSLCSSQARLRGLACLRRHFRAGEGGKYLIFTASIVPPRLKSAVVKTLAHSQHQISAAKFAVMFLRKTQRKKDGNAHEYWSVVENKRVVGGRVVQRHVLYLGEINSSQATVWRKAIEVLDDDAGHPRTMALFPEDRCAAVASDASVVQLRLSDMRLASHANGAPAGWPGSCGRRCS